MNFTAQALNLEVNVSSIYFQVHITKLRTFVAWFGEKVDYAIYSQKGVMSTSKSTQVFLYGSINVRGPNTEIDIRNPFTFLSSCKTGGEPFILETLSSMLKRQATCCYYNRTPNLTVLSLSESKLNTFPTQARTSNPPNRLLSLEEGRTVTAFSANHKRHP